MLLMRPARVVRFAASKKYLMISGGFAFGVLIELYPDPG
jgi:hypothetical protein